VSSYGADFAMHVAMQPVLRLGRWFLIPSLLAAGLLDGPAAGVLLFASGMIARTLYTAGRLIQAGAMGARRPWVALAVGAIPVLGNLAYPAQLAYRAAEEHGSLARFLLADAGAALGRAVPLWGGKGSLLEHYLSRFPGLLARRLSLAGKVPATKPGLP
jgi:hypothetical protein